MCAQEVNYVSNLEDEGEVCLCCCCGCLNLAWIAQVLKSKSEAIGDGLYEEAALLFKRETELKAALRNCKDEYMPLPEVTEADIESVVSAWTGIPVERMKDGEMDKLTNLDKSLHERVVGQENAITAIARAMRRY